tara:strand:+ start:960 stop:1874 length:915 start_codon:yes stop_codon:yes gene_type:complete
MKIYVVDIDGTICNNTFGEYEKAKPFLERIQYINFLFNQGNYIKYFTARGSTTRTDWRTTTESQLKEWGALYHELILGKPEGDFFLDDKAFNCNQWFFQDFTLDNKVSLLSDDIQIIQNSFKRNIETFLLISKDIDFQTKIIEISESIKKAIRKGGKVIFAGNGGSFSDAQHIAAEFVARFNHERVPLPSLTLGTNTSIQSAIGNDYGFDFIFSRELEAIHNKSDIFIAITTSGNSRNIINAVEKAKELGLIFYILTGKTGGTLQKYNENLLKIPSESTDTIQQQHILVGHIICQLVEKDYLTN